MSQNHQPSVGRIVQYTLPQGLRPGNTVRPAVIVQVWSAIDPASTLQTGVVNAAVFLDGSNDEGLPPHAYSIPYDASGTPGTWRWPERA